MADVKATKSIDQSLATDVEASAATSLLVLLAHIAALGYQFITPTPATHLRFLSRHAAEGARSLREIFGWNCSFQTTDVTPQLLKLMANADVLLGNGNLRSAVRIASIDDDLFLHSSFPTREEASVFFGPDTYRFVRLIRESCSHMEYAAARYNEQRPVRILDLGCGSGAGGIAAARVMGSIGQHFALTLSDINPAALRYAAINADFAHLPATTILSDGFQHIDGAFDLIIANPPYMQDEAQRAYRHGGAQLGRDLSVRLATEALPHLAPGGSLILYTGVAIVDGRDGFLEELHATLQQSGCTWSYSEIDADVFGEELDRPAYRQAERIAAVGLVATRKRLTAV